MDEEDEQGDETEPPPVDPGDISGPLDVVPGDVVKLSELPFDPLVAELDKTESNLGFRPFFRLIKPTVEGESAPDPVSKLPFDDAPLVDVAIM